MKKGSLLFITLLLVGTLGTAWQSDILPRIVALETFATQQAFIDATQDYHIHNLNVVIGDPTQETFPTPAPNLVLAYNRNAVNVNIRAVPDGAIIGKMPPGAGVWLCIGQVENVSGRDWQRVASGGVVAVQFLEVRHEMRSGEGC